MENFGYWAPTRYTFGHGAENETGAQAALEKMTNVLVVYGHSSAIRSGVLGRVCDSLAAAGIKVTQQGGIDPNPTDDRVYEGINIVRQNGIDGIIAVGGGSVIDTAKAIAAGAVYDGDFWDFWAGKAKVEKALPVGVVLTIPAAGSEGSGNSVITRREGMHKISLRTDYWLRPRFALLNPELTFTLPEYQTCAGAVDMMAHIFERYYSPTKGTETTDRLSEGLVMAIMDRVRAVLDNPDDYDARANLMWAGTMAHNGICGCGKAEDWASHGLEHELSAVYGVTHGAGLAVVNSAWMEFMAANRPAKVAQMAHRIFAVPDSGDAGADAMEGVRRLRQFYTSIGMPVTLAQLGVENPDIDDLVRRVHVDKGEVFGAYYPITPDVSRAIYTLMIDGGQSKN